MSVIKLIVNNIVATPLEVELKKEGDRAIDQMQFKVARNVSVESNNTVVWMQDYVTLDNLSAIYNLQATTKDESNNNNHGTATNITYESGAFDDYCALFNGTSSKIVVPDTNELDFSGEFDILVWLKWTATTTSMPILSKRSSSSNGWQLEVNTSTAGDVSFRVGSSIVTSSSAGFNDGNYHLVRATRNSSNLITLYIDGVSKGTVSSSTNLTDTNTLDIGTDSVDSDYFAGSISRIRLYNSQILNSEANKLYTKKNPKTIMKFGGYVTKIEDKTTHSEVIAQSYGKILGESEIRGTVFNNATPESIVNSLITDNTSFTYTERGASSGITIGKYTADGKLIDIIRNLGSLTNKVFYTTPTNLFVFEPAEYNITTVHLQHGVNSRILENGYDDTEIVNDLTVLGVRTTYSTEETQNLSSASTMDLANGAITVKVTNGGTELMPEIDYTLDSVGKTITFTTAKSGSTVATYDYEKPLFIRGTKESSQTTYGVHAKRLNLPWITNRQDGVRFVQSYLNRYKDINRKIKIEIGELDNYLNENDLVFVTNSNMGLSAQTFVVKSIQWKYPKFETVLNVGEYYFDYFEYDKQIVQKLHNVEGALSTIKEIREYESPEEILPLVDSMGVTVQDVHKYTETLNMSDSDHIYDKSRATWGSSSYGSRRPGVSSQDVYGSGA
ncbi:MAG: LamG domain-containing protein [Pelagibacteraceae bacterium]|nr:LamG domain-containing protein [Pelagibacteraceae bacterium]